MYIAGHLYVVKQAFDRQIDIFELMLADIFKTHDYSAITNRNQLLIESSPYLYLHLLGDYHIHFGNNFKELKSGWVYQKMGVALDTYKKMTELGYSVNDSKRGVCHSLVEYVIDIHLERRKLSVSLDEVKSALTLDKVSSTDYSDEEKESARHYIARIHHSQSFHEILARAAANKFFKTQDQKVINFFYNQLSIIYDRLDDESIELELNNNIDFIKRNIKWKY